MDGYIDGGRHDRKGSPSFQGESGARLLQNEEIG